MNEKKLSKMKWTQNIDFENAWWKHQRCGQINRQSLNFKYQHLVECIFFFFQWGEDSAEIQVNVVGKPDMPGGPLKVTEVTKKSCMLAWKPPADNGGYQITHYEVEKLDNTNGSWLPVKSVKSMSLEVMEFQVRGYKIRLI